MKVLIICPSKVPSTGNLCTVKRIQNHLTSAGIYCAVKDVDSFVSEGTLCPQQRLCQFIFEDSITGVLFLHAYKGANILLCIEKDCTCNRDKFPVPYGIIFGGTDLNLDISNAEKLISMQKVMRFARFGVAFTEALKETALNLDPKLKVLVQPQAVEIADSLKHNVSASFENGGSKQGLVFIMVTGIRPVKDPLFILDAWMQLTIMHKDKKLKLLIIGPILDEVYAKCFFWNLKALREKYLESDGTEVFDTTALSHKFCEWADSDAFPILYSLPLPANELKSLMLSGHVFASVNSSESEGMSSAILESMAVKIPVIARNNSGNRAVISNGTTGLLYDTPDDFVQQSTKLILQSHLRESIVVNAFDIVLKSHSVEKENYFYKNLCLEYFS